MDNTPDAVAAVDEPTDTLIAQLSQYTRISPAIWVAFLPAFLQALSTGLDKVLENWPETDPAVNNRSPDIPSS